MSEISDPVMEAFGELAVALGHTATRVEWPAVKAFFNLLNVHAHELAEEIRNSEKLRDYTDDHMGDCEAAAGLIDPEAQAKRCVGCGEPKDDGQAHGYFAEFGGCV